MEIITFPRHPHILPVRALRDNYIWMICDPTHSNAWAVDPGESKPVLDFLKKKALSLAGILITHHHADHSGGVQQLHTHFPHIPIYGSKQSPLHYLTHKLSENDLIENHFFKLITFEIPGHTLDHLAFYGDIFGLKVLFCGDTLFSAGCGKIFEGTPAMMYNTLSKIKTCNESTYLYCGHEYTLNNLYFAKKIDKNNILIDEYIEKIKQHLTLDPQFCTLPSTIGIEKSINPFLNCEDKIITAAAEQYNGKILLDPIDVLKTLREWKNNFVAEV